MRKIDYYNLTFLGINVVLSWVDRKKTPSYLKFMPYLLLLSFLLELAADILMAYGSNLYLYHIFEPLQYVGFSSLFYLFFKSLFLKRAIIISAIIVLSCAVIFALTIQPLTENNSYTNIIKNCFLLGWILLFFRDLLLREEIIDLWRTPLYLISCGLIIYVTGKLSIDFSLNLIRSSKWADVLYTNSLFLDIFLWGTILVTYLQILLKQSNHAK